MKLFIFSFLFVSSVFSFDELTSCVETKVSKTSVIFTCMHGEYYVKYTSFSKKEVETFKVLYTKADKFKYLKKK